MDRLNLVIPDDVRMIIDRFEKNGKQIFIVGGVVRDVLLKRSLVDWDFTTDATPEEIMGIVPDSFYDNQFGTVGVKSDGRPLEITTFRTEKGYSDNRHPDKVEWGKDLKEDLARRDFTINAMALKRTGSHPGGTFFELMDYFGGKEDIENQLMRAVGNPDMRFSEDALRMMRAVRIAAQLKFSIEENTFEAIQKNAGNITQISAERVRDELLKIMASEYAADGYLLLRNCRLGQYILPEMENAFGVEQKSPGRHHIYDVGTHSVEALRNCPSANPITRLATLMHDVGKVKTFRKHPDGRITFYNHEMESEKIAIGVADRLRFSNEQKEVFVKLVRWHQFTVDERQTDSAVRRVIRNVGRENVEELLYLRTGDRIGGGARETSWRLEEFKKRLDEVQKQPFSITDLKVSGHDVMKEKKVSCGPIVGKYLETLFDEVVDKGLANEKEVLLTRLREVEL
jgi:tRNA nucleotidyltransferase (CCA-adding enzyme)